MKISEVKTRKNGSTAKQFQQINAALLVFATGLGFAGMPAFATEPMKPSGALEATMPNDTKTFFETAASSNMFEIEASKLAKTKASRPELKEFADHMIKDHTEANAKLQTLAQAKGMSLPTGLISRHQAMLDALKADKPGKDFDKDYENKMVLSHKEAVSLFDQTAKESMDSDVKTFAAAMLPTLQMHGGMASKLNT